VNLDHREVQDTGHEQRSQVLVDKTKTSA
jgi:hypothetical protein